MVAPIESVFPGLKDSPYQFTSPATRDYNCMAWAAGDVEHWWWPNPYSDAVYWPPGVPMEETLDAFVAALATLGYALCEGGMPEIEFERVALFAKADAPTHAARQLPNGRWTSKLGLREDIEHELDALNGEVYGAPARFLKRPRPTATTMR